MSIEKITMFTVICDNCKENAEDYYNQTFKN